MSSTGYAKYIEVFLVFVLVAAAGFLRFTNLGYSDYIPDETTVLWNLKEYESFYGWDFFMEQRKGPMQFVVAYVPFLFTQNVFDQFVMRFPFALAGTLSVLVFYLIVRRITNNVWAALLSSLLFASAGFFTVFSRVVQYQSLNLLFSLLSLYFFYEMSRSTKASVCYSLLGALFFSLSLLSHWDAVFFIVPNLYFILLYLFGQPTLRKEKITVLFVMMFTFITVAGVFLFPYINRYSLVGGNAEYFSKRVSYSLSFSGKLRDYYARYELYNPFGFWAILLPISIVSLVSIRKTWIYWLWLFSSLMIFLIFVKSPGTHVYNLSIPLYFLAGLGLSSVFSLRKTWFKALLFLLLLPFAIFLYYQTYILFVDAKIEYPIFQERILNFTTRPYSSTDLLNNKIGFTVNRKWAETRAYMESIGTDYHYVTNDDTSISNFYLNGEYGYTGKYYLIGVKRPYSMVKDYTFSQIKGKTIVHNIEKDEETVVKIYQYTRGNQ